MNIFDFLEKYKIEGKRINIRSWGSYQLSFQFRDLDIGTPAVYGWGISEKLALAMFLTELHQMGYTSAVEQWMPADIYKDYLTVEFFASIDDLFSINSTKEEPIIDGSPKLLKA